MYLVRLAFKIGEGVVLHNDETRSYFHVYSLRFPRDKTFQNTRRHSRCLCCPTFTVCTIVLCISIGLILESLIKFEYSVFVLKTLDSMHMAQHWILTILPSNHLTKIELGRNYLTTIYTAFGGYGA